MMSIIAIAAALNSTPGGASGPWYDDAKLKEALEARGHEVAIIGWEDPRIDLCQFDAVFVSTTWNGCDEPQAFLSWLDRCESDGRKRLINSREVIDDGFIKYRYLSILLDFFGDRTGPGRPGYITPTAFFISEDPPHERVTPLHGRSLWNILSELDDDPWWEKSDIVIKPAVSADGKDTFVYNRTGRTIPIDEDKRRRFVLIDIAEAEAKFYGIAHDRIHGGAVLQPYMQGVEEGELSLTFFKNRCSHAVQKPPLFKGDGSARRKAVRLMDLPSKTLEFAQNVIDRMATHYGDGALIRSRVDIIHQDGVPVLCEFECVEPNTNIKIIADQFGGAAADTIIQAYAGAVEAGIAHLSEQPTG